jgi:hypothetical protein
MILLISLYQLQLVLSFAHLLPEDCMFMPKHVGVMFLLLHAHNIVHFLVVINENVDSKCVE